VNDNFTVMTIIIDKKNQKEAHRILSEKMKKNRKEDKLARHFGKLTRNIGFSKIKEPDLIINQRIGTQSHRLWKNYSKWAIM